MPQARDIGRGVSPHPAVSHPIPLPRSGASPRARLPAPSSPLPRPALSSSRPAAASASTPLPPLSCPLLLLSRHLCSTRTGTGIQKSYRNFLFDKDKETENDKENENEIDVWAQAQTQDESSPFCSKDDRCLSRLPSSVMFFLYIFALKIKM